MSKVAEHLAQALCSLPKSDEANVIGYVLEDPDVMEAVVELLVDRLRGEPHGKLELQDLPIATNGLKAGVTSKEWGMRVCEGYISELQQNGIQIDRIDRVWAKTSGDLWVAIPFATELRPNRYTLIARKLMAEGQLWRQGDSMSYIPLEVAVGFRRIWN